jgi:hypothetical protein
MREEHHLKTTMTSCAIPNHEKEGNFLQCGTWRKPLHQWKSPDENKNG